MQRGRPRKYNVTREELMAIFRRELLADRTAHAEITILEPCPSCGVNPTIVAMVMEPGPRMESKCTACGYRIPSGCKSRETHDRDGNPREAKESQ